MDKIYKSKIGGEVKNSAPYAINPDELTPLAQVEGLSAGQKLERLASDLSEVEKTTIKNKLGAANDSEVVAIEGRVTANEADIADHQTRITSLESGSSYTPPADYADVPAMLADQANQVENEEYTVTNANGWSTISHSGWATFKKKATSTASESDYDLREQQDFDTVGGNNIGWVNVLDYGADPTGATSNTAAFNSALTALSGGFGVIYVPAGTYKFNAKWVINKRVRIVGEGEGKNYGWYSGTKIISDTNIDLWEASVAGISIEHLGLEWHGASNPTTATGLYVLNTDTDVPPNMPIDKSQKLNLTNVSVRGFYDNIYIEACATWVFDKVTNVAPIRYGLHVKNATIPDAGDWSISNSMFFQPMATPGATAIHQVSSGGGKIVNTKFNGAFNYDIYSDLNNSSVILQVSNCSFENFVVGAIYCADYAAQIIIGNEFAPYRAISGAAMVEFNNVEGSVISSNSFIGSNHATNKAIKVTNSENINVLGNSYTQFTVSDPTVFSLNTNLFYDRNEKVTTILDKTSSFTIASTDNRKDNICNSASLITVTIPNDATVPIGFESNYWRIGTGPVSFSPASGVTLLYDATELPDIANQYNAVAIKKIAVNTWLLYGALKKV